MFDLETQSRIPPGPRDWTTFTKMRYSLAGVQNVRTGETTIYSEAEAGELLRRLGSASLIVGHNIRGFDYAILERYENHELADAPTLDFMHEYRRAYPAARYASLEGIARATLGRGKSGAGKDAPALWQQGRLSELETYLRADLQLTADLFLAAEEARSLLASVDGRILRFNVNIPQPKDGRL